MVQQNELQAFFPEGSRVVPNPHGTAPGIDLDVPRDGKAPCRFFALPGVPAEMREMWHGYVAGAVESMNPLRRIICRRNIKCFGGGESQIEAMLPDLIRRGRTPTVGITASRATITLRIVAEGATREECEAQIEPTAAAIRECLGSLVYGEGDDELQDSVIGLLRKHRRTLATVEIGTAGYVANCLGGVADHRDVYLGGLVAASKAAIMNLLGIDSDLLSQHALASEAVAVAMAAACRQRFQTDYGLAVSGFPAPPSEGVEAEPAFFALATPGDVKILQIPFASHPDLLTIYSAKQAMNLARLNIS
jgi:nicotinamide-nucleotide amidase